MSIEETLERIALAIEKIQVNLLKDCSKSCKPIAKPQGFPSELNTPPTPPTPPSITIEELNKELVETFNRLGDRTQIDNILKRHGVEKLSELPENKYITIRDEIRELS